MKVNLVFQYKAPDDDCPEEVVQDEQIKLDSEFIPIPNINDSVNYIYSGKRRNFKVVSRHFSYICTEHINDHIVDYCVVNIVVTDISDEEMDSRFK